MVIQVRGSNYVLADRAHQERRIAAWGALLSQSGQEGSRVAALQWLERTVPDSATTCSDGGTSTATRTPPYADAYANLINGAGPAATRHEAFLAVGIDSHRLRRSIRQAGGGPEGTAKVLRAELSWVRQALARAEIDVVGDLGPADLARLVRTQYDPAATVHDRPPRRAPHRVRDAGRRGADGRRGRTGTTTAPTAASTPSTGSPSGQPSRSRPPGSTRSSRSVGSAGPSR